MMTNNCTGFTSDNSVILSRKVPSCCIRFLREIGVLARARSSELLHQLIEANFCTSQAFTKHLGFMLQLLARPLHSLAVLIYHLFLFLQCENIFFTKPALPIGIIADLPYELTDFTSRRILSDIRVLN